MIGVTAYELPTRVGSPLPLGIRRVKPSFHIAHYGLGQGQLSDEKEVFQR